MGLHGARGQLLGVDRLVREFLQLEQFAIQPIHFRQRAELACVPQPGQQPFDARQLLGEVFWLLLVAH